MAKLTLDSIAVDCPDPVALATFYAGLLGVESRGDFIYLPGDKIEIWFQQVEDYQAPTWPTQERGQQLHFDIAVQDKDAIIARAVELGATLSETRDGYHYPILLDPAGHPFCLVFEDAPDRDVEALNIDCPNASELAGFYQRLLGGTVDDSAAWAYLNREAELTLAFQSVEDYQAPTWPTQERGQQIHIDFHTDDRQEAVHRAVELGAERKEVNSGFTVMFDPARHPFCICDSQE